MTKRTTILVATLMTLVGSLVRGVSCVCQVRAKAAVGYGPWSRGRKLAR